MSVPLYGNNQARDVGLQPTAMSVSDVNVTFTIVMTMKHCYLCV